MLHLSVVWTASNVHVVVFMHHRLDVDERVDHGNPIRQAPALPALGGQVWRQKLHVCRTLRSIRRWAAAHRVVRQFSLSQTRLVGGISK